MENNPLTESLRPKLKIRYSPLELKKIAEWLWSQYGSSVKVTNGKITEAAKACLPPDRWKDWHYQLISKIVELVKSFGDRDTMMESTASLRDHGVIDLRNGHVATSVAPVEEVRIVEIPSVTARIAPLPMPKLQKQVITQDASSLIEMLVEINRQVIAIHALPLNCITTLSDLDIRRVRALCIQANNGLSSFEELL